jgi:hypothetical protein
MSKEDDLRDMLDTAALRIAKVDTNPRTWQTWLVYLLGKLEAQSLDADPSHQAAYREMLSALQDSIRNRERTGGW